MADSNKTKEPRSGERIARRISRAGLCSRREAERWISEGRVKLNGKVLDSPAVVVVQSDQVEVDGQALPDRDCRAFPARN